MNLPPLIDKEAIVALKEAIAPVAAKIGDTAEHLYFVFVKQQVVLGLQDLIVGLVELGIAITLMRMAYKNRNSLRDGLQAMNGISLAIVTVVALVALFVFPEGVGKVVASLPRLINPEYFAIQDIINHFKK